MNDYSEYLYYKGEKDCPMHGAINAGKAFWWRIEASAFKNGDKKKSGKLSKTMLAFLREWHWEPDCTLAWELAVQRATEMYCKGLWSPPYFERENLKVVENTQYVGKL